MTPESQNNSWPLPKFFFSVIFKTSGFKISFQEVSGLELKEEVTSHEIGNNPTFSTIKMSGILKASSVTLKKGVFESKNESVVIQLHDESRDSTMSWSLANAWTKKSHKLIASLMEMK